MQLLQRFRRQKPLPARVAGGVARRVGRAVKGAARLVTSPLRR
jgi:hypothetical protein